MNNPDNIFGKSIKGTPAELLRLLELSIGEGFVSSVIPEGPAVPRNIFGRRPHYRQGDSLSFLAGMASAGLRAGAFLRGSQLDAGRRQLQELARQNLPAMIHYAHTVQDEKSAPASYNEPLGVGQEGCFQFIASDLQELIDFTIIGHRVAELALIPGICGVGNVGLLQEGVVPDAESLRHFLGEPDEQVSCPTPAQRLLFGKNRRRIPQWYNLDTPFLNGARKDKPALGLEGAARERYFYHHLPEAISQVREEFGNRFGRQYGAIKNTEAGKADYLLIVQGTDFQAAEMAVNQARREEKARVGGLSLSQLRPFPKDELEQWLSGKKGVTILETANGPVAGDSLFLNEIKAVLRQMGRKAPELFAGVYAGSLSPEAGLSAIKNMLRGGARKERFYLGFDFTRSDTAFPQHEIMLQAIGREYPNIQENTLEVSPAEGAPPAKPGNAVANLPFAIHRYQDQGAPFTRLSRFYHNTACFYQQGNRQELVASPFQALPVVPVATANFASPAEGPAGLPLFLPGNCTGCGACIAYCPHSALPSIAISVQSLIRAGMKMAADQGTPIPQLMGIERKLVKVAEGLIRENPDRVERAEDFLPASFELLAEQSKMEGEKLERAQEGINILNGIIGHFPIAVTEPFFHQKKRSEKGTAQLFSIAIDPHACTGCGLCAAVCEDDALVMSGPEPELVQQMDATLRLWEQLPDTPADTINQLIREPEYNSISATLLSRHFYLSLSGGATTESGAPAKSVLHWLTAVLESVMQPRVEEQAKALEQQVEELAKNIHQQLSNALPKRDFQLSEVGDGKLPLEDVIRQLDTGPQATVVDATAIQRKVGLLNDLKALLWALREGPTGGGRARYGLLLAGNEAMPWADDYPYNPFTAPVIWEWDGSAPERLLGILKGQARHILDHIRLLRRAALEANNKYRPEAHDEEIGTLEWGALSEAEKKMLSPAILVGDARLLSAGSTALQELLASGLPVKIVLLDDAAVPAGEPGAAWLATAQSVWASTVPAHRAFLLKGSLAENAAAFAPLREGLHHAGPALFHLLAPRPEQHTFSGPFWPEASGLALQTRAFPSLVFSPDNESGYLSSALSLEGNPAPESDWVTTSLEYKEGGEEKKKEYILTFADWLFSLKSWQPLFSPLQPESGSPVPVAEYLPMDEKQQKGKIPVVLAVDDDGQLKQYMASPEVVSATRQALRHWNSLREMAGLRSPFPLKMREALEQEWGKKHEKELEELKASYEARFQEQEKALMEQVKAKLRDKLMELSRRGEQLSSLEEEVNS